MQQTPVSANNRGSLGGWHRQNGKTAWYDVQQNSAYSSDREGFEGSIGGTAKCHSAMCNRTQLSAVIIIVLERGIGRKAIQHRTMCNRTPAYSSDCEGFEGSIGRTAKWHRRCATKPSI